MKVRDLARTGAAALLAAGAVTCAATPALAAEDDLRLAVHTATDGVITNVVMTVTNHGTTTPKKISLALDTSAIDESRATIITPRSCVASDTGFECGIPDGSGTYPGPGESMTQNVVFWGPGDSAPGAVGDLRVTMTTDEDTDTASVPVVMPALRSPVLQAYPVTVTQIKSSVYTGRPIPPGGKSIAYVEIYNRGARSAVGVRTVGRLPKGVRFVPDGLDNCEFTPDKRTATCVWAGDREYTLVPQVIDETMDQFESSTRVEIPIVVDKDAKGPAKLTGGEWEFAPIATEEPELDADARQTLVWTAPAQDEPAPKPDDHIKYDVLIGAAATGDGSGGGSGEPSLPITGPGSAAAAGSGAALVAFGTFLLFALRRRRTVR